MYSLTKTTWSFLVAAALLLVSTSLAYADDSYSNNNWNSNWSGGSQSNRVFNADLRGSNEVPAVSTSSTSGIYRGEMSSNSSSFAYSIDVSNGDEIKAAHLHCAAAGVNGPVVVGLFEDANGTDVNGRLVSGTVNDSKIMDADCASKIGYNIDTMSDLTRAISEGKIYANVHSEAYPNGVARGQISMTGSGGGWDGHNNDWNDDSNHWRDHAEKYWWNNCWWYKHSDGGWYDARGNKWNEDNHYGNEKNKNDDWRGKDNHGNSWNEGHDRHDSNGHGSDGYDKNGRDGKNGKNGKDGADGYSAYSNDWNSSYGSNDSRDDYNESDRNDWSNHSDTRSGAEVASRILERVSGRLLNR